MLSSFAFQFLFKLNLTSFIFIEDLKFLWSTWLILTPQRIKKVLPFITKLMLAFRPVRGGHMIHASWDAG